MIKTQGIMEIIVYVRDMQKMVSFYRDVLSLPIQYPHVNDYSDQYWVTLDGGGCILALHGGGSGEAIAENHKIVFRVADIASARTALLANGVPCSEIRTPAPGTSVVDCKDPENNYFSIEFSNK